MRCFLCGTLAVLLFITLGCRREEGLGKAQDVSAQAGLPPTNTGTKAVAAPIQAPAVAAADQPPPAPRPDTPPAASGLRLTLTETPLGNAPFKYDAPSAFSADGKHVLFGVHHQAQSQGAPDVWTVALDGQDGNQPFDQLGTLLLSADGKTWAYSGKRGEKWLAVIDGGVGPLCDNVEQLQLSPDGMHVGYIAAFPNSQVAVVDGVGGKPYIAGVSDLVFSPDSKHAAYFAGRGTPLNNHIDDALVVDGTERAAFPERIAGSLCWSPDSAHLAYAAEVPAATPGTREVRVFVDGKPGPAGYDSMQAGTDARLIRFSPDGRHLAFVAQRGQKSVLVVDGRESRPYDLVRPESVQFSPDSAHWACIAFLGTRSAAVVDGREGAGYDQVAGFQFGAEGGHFAYAATRGTQMACVTDAGEGKPYTHVGGPWLSPDGRHVAYTAMRADSRTVVVLDGREQAPHMGVSDDGVGFSPDSKHLAYAAMDAADPQQGGEKTVIVLDGAAQKTVEALPSNGGKFPGINTVNAASLRFRPDSRHLAYTVSGLGDAGQQTVIVVDSVPSKGFEQAIPQARLVFDGPNQLYLLGTHNGAAVRISLEIAGS